MISLTQFVGAFLHQLTQSRKISDRASLKVANDYLEDDFLRGFPVPRMTFDSVELEFGFEVAPTSLDLLREPEIRKNITHRLCIAITDLSHSQAFKQYFGDNLFETSYWKRHIDQLKQDIHRILKENQTQYALVQKKLVSALENFFYDIQQHAQEQDFLDSIRQLFQARHPSPENPQSNHLTQWAESLVSSVIEDIIPSVVDNHHFADEMTILVGGSQLEARNAEPAHKAKIVFTREDRKWVTTNANGKKQYILDR
ncbi:MAG: hypothetical protein AAGB12_08210 [Pseudomonadota bacterium]